MLRGMYDFGQVDEKTLGFKSGEQLLFLGTHHIDANWFRASNRLGDTGLVPANYVKIDHDYNGESLLNFLNDALIQSENHRRPKHQLDELIGFREKLLADPTIDFRDKIIDLEDEMRRARQIAMSNLSNLGQSYMPKDEQIENGRILRTSQERLPISRSDNEDDEDGEGDMIIVPPDGYQNDSTQDEDEEATVLEVLPKPKTKTIHSHHRTKTDRDHQHQKTHTQPTAYKLSQPIDAKPSIISIPSLRKSSDTSSINSREDGRMDDGIHRIACEMVDKVRNSVGISHEKSQIALYNAFHFWNIKASESDSTELEQLLKCLEGPCTIGKFPDLLNSAPDSKKLQKLFQTLTDCKDDEQQRSWALHEDEAHILETLNELNRILKNADHSITKYVMDKDHYCSIHTLAQYYQMEIRQVIRKELRTTFTLISSLDVKAVNVLSNSVLPMELAREIQEISSSDSSKDVKETLVSTGNLLCLLLCPGETLPITHFEHLGREFVVHVLRLIESPPQDDDTISDCLINLLLAYNLQFLTNDINLTIQGLFELEVVPIITQKIINLVNWGRDPLQGHLPYKSKENSVLKLLIEMFSCPTTAKIFYTNDVKVLLDIVIRFLNDLGHGDEGRGTYLALLHQILRNTEFTEHRYRIPDLANSLTGILIEEEPSSSSLASYRNSQAIIRDIFTEFPYLRNPTKS